MTENPPPPSGTPEGDGRTPPPPQNPYGSQPSTPPPPPQNPYSSQPPPADPYADPYAGNPPSAGQTPYGSPPQQPADYGGYGAEAYPVSHGGPAPVAGAQPAGVGIRFLARVIDSLLFVLVAIVLYVAIDSVIVRNLVSTILFLGYYVYMESSRGRTLGKQVLRLRVLGHSAANPTVEEALRRNAWLALSLLGGLAVIGFLAGLLQLAAAIAIAVTISQDALKRGWHDKFANTSVIKEG